MIESCSSLATFLTCAKLYDYKYNKLLRTKGYSSALGVGTLFHALIEDHANDKPMVALDRELARLLSEVDPEKRNEVITDRDFATGFFNLWRRRWSDGSFANDKFEWVASEKEWRFHLGEADFNHVGKGDGLVRHREWGTLFYYEFKTAADRDRDTYMGRLEIDAQVSSNILALRREGIDVQGVLYDVAWKPGLRRKTDRKTMPDETTEEFYARTLEAIEKDPTHYFQREIIYRNDSALAWHEEDLKGTFAAIHLARQRNRFYRNTRSCVSPYGAKCPFFSACIEQSPELESLYQLKDRKLPELSKEIQHELQDPKDD